MNRPTTSVIIAGLVAATLAACGPMYKDTDHEPGTARAVPVDLEVEDSLDADEGDEVDWKQVTPMEDGTARLALRVGDPFKGKHSLKGRVVVFDRDANEQTRRAIEPNVVRYDVAWEAKADTTYLVKFEADRGRAPYSIEYDLEPADPCADVVCDEYSECREGTCVQVRPKDCGGECPKGLVCVEGECVEPCDGGCPRGFDCDEDANECVKDPCYGKRCPSGHYCRRGRCIKRRVRKPKPKPEGCSPPCGAGEECKGTRCVKVEQGGPIAARIVQATPSGSKTVLILNRGSRHEVKVGQRGKLQGVGSFKVVEVYPTRCKAILGKPATAISGAKNAVIYR
ncbi:MAG: hypothetical protein ACQEXJ_23525 [Myxococcota bacterium]